jgi:DNA mismatch repair protein MutL
VYFEERFSTALHRSNLENWDKLFENQENSNPSRNEKLPEIQTLRFESALNKPDDQIISEEKVLFQLHHRYIIRPVKAGMMILDQQLVHERILFERFVNQLKNKAAQSQQSLFPQTLSLSAPDFALVLELEQEIYALGFRFEVFGKNTLLINGIPATLATGTEKALFEGLLEQFKINQSELSLPLRENLARALAKRACIKTGQKLVKEEMQSLIEGLFACLNPNYSPDGKPTFFIFEATKIESHFNRQ